MDHPRRPRLSEHDRAAIDQASDEAAAAAPPLTDEQIASLRRVTRRARGARRGGRKSAA